MNAEPTLLPTANPDWGFWGTSVRNGYEPGLTWEAAGDALATAFDLASNQIRDLLDSRFGRHLADDLSFIPGGPTTAEVIEEHLQARLVDPRWNHWFRQAIEAIPAA